MWSFLIFFVAFSGSVVLVSSRDVCETKVCIERAKQFLDSMDTTIDPCDDFYHFSCGQFLVNNNVDEQEKVASVFSELESNLQIKLRRSLLKINSSDEELPNFMRQLRNLYDKCLDTSQIEEDGMISLLTLINYIEGNAIIDPSKWTNDFSLERRTKLFTNAGIISDFLLDLDFIPNLKNTSELIINFSHSNDIDDESLIKHVDKEKAPVEAEDNDPADEEDEKEIRRYVQLMFSVIRNLSGNITREEVTQIIILNRRLIIAAMELMELKKNVTNLVNVLTVEELQNKYSALNWTEYIRSKTFGLINVTNNTAVNVMEISYLSTVNEILLDTDPLIISKYQTLKVIYDHMGRVNRSFRNLKLKMANSGAVPAIPRWKMCVEEIVQDFGMGISYVYVKDYGTEELRNFSIDIVTRLKEQFDIFISKSNWFDNETLVKAKEKLNAVVNQIAYSEELRNESYVESYYKGLNFDNMSYFDSILQLRKLNHIRNVENFLDEDHSETSNQLQFVEVTVVNGFYIPFSNSIQIPLGILQSKFIDVEGPLYLNYGSLGFTIAHEFTHAFDDFGRQFDYKGNVANWYSDRATELNKEKEKCIIDQFNAYVEPETKLHLNGQNTLSENMADLGGILVSYNAYKNATPFREGLDGLSLPGLNYTIDQQFWLAYATTWCSAYRSSKLRNMLEYDLHSPAQFRINGALQNVAEFSNDFHCAKGSPMNPIKKCTVF